MTGGPNNPFTPALSATSDKPNFADTAPSAKPAPQPENAATPPAGEPTAPADALPSSEPDDGGPSSDERAAAEEHARAERELLEPIPEVPPDPGARPTRQSFDDPDSYEAAVVAWSSQRARQEFFRQEGERLVKERQEAAMKAGARLWEQRSKRAAAAHPDFHDVVLNPELQISALMTNAIVGAENGPELAYHLGKHPEEASRIAAMAPARQLLEIGRLSARLGSRANGTPPAKPAAKAPAATARPRAPARKSVHEMTGDEYYEHVMSTRAQQRHGVSGRRGAQA